MTRASVAVAGLLMVAIALAGCIGGSAPAGEEAGPAGNATTGPAGDARPEGPPAQVEHVHDRWEGDAAKTVVDRSVATQATTDVDPTGSVTDNIVCVFICGSFVEFTPAEGAIVPPGTSEVTVEASWDSQAPPGHTLRVFGSYMAANMTDWEFLGQLESGTPLTVNTTVEMADGGHAKQSLWRFRLFVIRCSERVQNSTLYCFTRQDTEEFTADVTVTAERVDGELPVEPAHPDWWGDGPVREVGSVSGTAERTGVGTYYLHANSSSLYISTVYAYLDDDEHQPIPPGSKVLVARVNWTNDAATADAAGVQPWLRYTDGTGLSWTRWEPESIGDGTARWVKELGEGETDGMYAQNRSRWSFYLGFTGDQTAPAEDPFLGEPVTNPYRFEGSYSLTVRVANTTELPDGL